IAKNCDGAVPQYGAFSDEDQALLDAAYGILDVMRKEIGAFQIHKAIAAIWNVVAEANRYFAAQEPWALKKTDPERMATVLYTTAEVLRVAAVGAQPFIPEGAGKLLDLLAVDEEKRQFRVEKAALIPGTPLPKPAPVFPRYVEEESEKA
ncbi:MAG: methionine--tRNA ligase, partial [Rhodobiaceae bacterium]|nr:methionine--tRNA ligase [Rhodobiaceae bacterium]